jgi:hypothetical protein
MNIDLIISENVATMKIDGILNSENAHILQRKLSEVLSSKLPCWNGPFGLQEHQFNRIGKICCFIKILSLRWRNRGGTQLQQCLRAFFDAQAEPAVYCKLV